MTRHGQVTVTVCVDSRLAVAQLALFAAHTRQAAHFRLYGRESWRLKARIWRLRRCVAALEREVVGQ